MPEKQAETGSTKKTGAGEAGVPADVKVSSPVKKGRGKKRLSRGGSEGVEKGKDDAATPTSSSAKTPGKEESATTTSTTIAKKASKRAKGDDGRPLTFAARYCPAGEVGTAQFKAIKSVFESRLQPALKAQSRHQDGVGRGLVALPSKWPFAKTK